MTDLNLDELEALEKAAAPIPWEVEMNPGSPHQGLPWGTVYAKDRLEADMSQEDAAFIVAMRNAAPRLIARIRELEWDIDHACRRCDTVPCCCDPTLVNPYRSK